MDRDVLQKVGQLDTLKHHLTVALRMVETAIKTYGTTPGTLQVLRDTFNPIVRSMSDITGINGPVALILELQSREAEALDFMFPNPTLPRPQNGNKTLDRPVWHILLDYAKGVSRDLERISIDRQNVFLELKNLEHENQDLLAEVANLKAQLANRPRRKTIA